jgi:hypothetical protein
VDLFLRMLTDVPDYPLSRFIFKELTIFKQILGMKLPSFVTFLERCKFQTILMQKTQVRYWKHGEQEQAVSQSNTSMLTIPFLREFIGRAETDP